eukprot:GEZU01008893.1.p1 GENE.GEZU01008893.1~~GEZU01008893.1.p1  ORF type:complete len:223 (-),score=64.18 GEZU01008893.1:51-653(-)
MANEVSNDQLTKAIKAIFDSKSLEEVEQMSVKSIAAELKQQFGVDKFNSDQIQHIKSEVVSLYEQKEQEEEEKRKKEEQDEKQEESEEEDLEEISFADKKRKIQGDRQAIDAKQNNGTAKKPRKEEEKIPEYVEIANLKRASVSVFRGRCLVDLREYYMPGDSSEPKPTKKGITFNREQWTKFKELIPTIDKMFEAKAGK